MLDDNKEMKFVMLLFAVISLVLIFMMINSFKFIDCCYFLFVVGFATRYYLLGKE